MQHDIKCKSYFEQPGRNLKTCTRCGWRDDKRLFHWHLESYHLVRTDFRGDPLVALMEP